MSRQQNAWLLLFLATVLPTCYAKQIPYGDYGFTLEEDSSTYVYPNTFNDLREVDFKDLPIRVVYGHGKLFFMARLKGGSYEKLDRQNTVYDKVKLESVHYLSAKKSGVQYAMLICKWLTASGSSNEYGVAQIFKLVDRRLTLVQQLLWDEHFSSHQPYESFDQKADTLVVRTAHYVSQDGHCCASAVDVVTLKWDGARFMRKSINSEPSDNGMKAGKQLNQ